MIETVCKKMEIHLNILSTAKDIFNFALTSQISDRFYLSWPD